MNSDGLAHLVAVGQILRDSYLPAPEREQVISHLEAAIKCVTVQRARDFVGAGGAGMVIGEPCSVISIGSNGAIATGSNGRE